MCKECKEIENEVEEVKENREQEKIRKVFLDDLPKKEGIGKNKGKQITDWGNSTGYKVKFVYDDIQGEVEIIDYYKKNKSNCINFKYKNNIYSMATSQFLNCQFGEILNKINHNYKYKIGEVITGISSGKLEILEQTRTGKQNKKAYKYKCLICGNEDIILEYHINDKKGCNVCGHNKTLKGYNDMWITNAKLASLLANPEDGYKYTQGANKSVDFKCPNCGNIIKNKKICDVNGQGLSCKKCSDGISYPEKFVFNVLEQLELDFETQLSKTTFKWCEEYKYDFYFEINEEEYIVETHGLQHYEESGGYYSLKKEQENDRLKKELALQNEIKEENYIVIDCRYSELEWIKNNILNSKLNILFDLSKINWLKCEEFSRNSRILQVCNLWNSGIISTVEIAKLMKLNQTTIIRYLKQGKELKWCNYNSKEELEKTFFKKGDGIKKVICLNNSLIFNSINEAAKYYNIKSSGIISQCCLNNQEFAGRNFKTDEPLYWMDYDKYLYCKNNENKLLDSNDVDWIKYNNFNCKQNFKSVCDLWNKGICSTSKISSLLEISTFIVRKYLKKGEELNICNYNSAKSNKIQGLLRSKKVICLNTKHIFNSLTQASNYYNTSEENIRACCNNTTKMAGKDLDSETYIQWQYYDEYLIKPKKLLSNNEIQEFRSHSRKNNKEIICLNTNERFYSIADASKKYDIDRAGITKCCQNKAKYAGRDPVTNECLRWMYYEDFLN